MARGWESKEIESQIEAAQTRVNRRPVQPESTEEQRLEMRERDCLQLSRTRILNDLQAAENPKYRDMLQQSLEFVEAKLSALDASQAASKPAPPE